MSASDRERIDRLLEENVAFRKELDGYRCFVSRLTSDAVMLPVPHSRLNLMLSGLSTPQPTRMVRPLRAIVFASAATLVLAVGIFGYIRSQPDPHRLNTTPEVASVFTGNIFAASKWISSTTGWKAPTFALTDCAAQIEKAAYGNGWACYEYDVRGNSVRLYFSKTDNFGQMQGHCGSHPLFEGKSGFGFREAGFSFYVVGEDRAALGSVLQAAHKDLANPPKPPLNSEPKSMPSARPNCETPPGKR